MEWIQLMCWTGIQCYIATANGWRRRLANDYVNRETVVQNGNCCQSDNVRTRTIGLNYVQRTMWSRSQFGVFFFFDSDSYRAKFDAIASTMLEIAKKKHTQHLKIDQQRYSQIFSQICIFMHPQKQCI